MPYLYKNVIYYLEIEGMKITKIFSDELSDERKRTFRGICRVNSLVVEVAKLNREKKKVIQLFMQVNNLNYNNKDNKKHN